jgi:hypothetical protein
MFEVMGRLWHGHGMLNVDCGCAHQQIRLRQATTSHRYSLTPSVTPLLPPTHLNLRMYILARIKDSAIYAWNADSTLRSWVETRKYPPGCGHRHCGLCLTCRYLETKQEKEQERRDEILSKIEHNRRVKRLQSKKRDISVDSGRRKKRDAVEQEQCSLLAKLPAELRLQIWEEVLCNTEEICIVPGRLARDRLNVRAERKCFPQILRTCQQMYAIPHRFPPYASLLIATPHLAIEKQSPSSIQETRSHSTAPLHFSHSPHAYPSNDLPRSKTSSSPPYY